MSAKFRYRRLGYVALNVTDLARSADFYRDIVGLDVSESVDRQWAALRCGADHHHVMLYQSAAPGLKRVAFELETEDDLDRAHVEIGRLGLAPAWLSDEEISALKQGRSFRFREPESGLTLEFFARMTHMALPFAKRLTKIARLGHIVVNVVDLEKTLALFAGQLGFRVSDEVDGYVSFLRCFPNPYHHSLALVRAEENRLNHVNFMVTDIDDIGRAYHRLLKSQVEIVFGPGRHQPSDSIFLYFLDPDRMTLEYSFGMEEFPEANARGPRIMERRPESLDSWGSVPTPAFGKVGRIEVSS